MRIFKESLKHPQSWQSEQFEKTVELTFEQGRRCRQASRRPEETQIKGKRETDRQTERKGKRRDKRENKWRASGAPRGWKEADTFYDFYPDHQHHHPPPFFSLLSFIPSSPPGHSIFTFLFGCLPILRRILLPSPSPPPLDAFSLSLSISHLLLFLIF